MWGPGLGRCQVGRPPGGLARANGPGAERGPGCRLGCGLWRPRSAERPAEARATLPVWPLPGGRWTGGLDGGKQLLAATAQQALGLERPLMV